MTYIGEILLLAINLAMAYYHAQLIKKDNRVRHGWWALGYLAIAVITSFITHSWALFICSLFLRKVFFDTALNLWRGLPITYVSTSTQSIVDKLHYKIWKDNSEVYLPIYLVAIIFINIFLL